MNYEASNRIKISERAGVSCTGADTLALARHAQSEPDVARVLELGSGAGMISVSMASRGCSVLAVDINPAALALTRENAAANGLDIEIRESDLFAKIDERFDLIIFNPPLGKTSHGLLVRPLEWIKARIGKREIVIRAVYWFVRSGRVRMIQEFAAELRQHLRERGRALVFIHRSECSLFDPQQFDCEILEEQTRIGMLILRVKLTA